MVAKLSKEAFKTQLATAKEKAKQGFNDFEPGQYMFKLTHYVMDKGNGGEERVVGKWSCIEGEEKAKDFLKYFSIEKALAILLQEWRAIGYDTDEMEETYEGLVKWCKMITKVQPVILATIYMKKGYPTMRIDELVSQDESTSSAETHATTAAVSKPSALSKPVGKAATAPAVSDVSDVEDVSDVDDSAAQPVQIEVGTKIAFTWKGVDKEGVIEELNEAEGKLKVIADNNGKSGRFPITTEMITGVIPN